jgi:hypothetical protein
MSGRIRLRRSNLGDRIVRMKRANQKHADDIIVPDGDIGMQRLTEATKHILSVPKPPALRPTHRKRRHRKR